MKISGLMYRMDIKCQTCQVWQAFHNIYIPSFDLGFKERQVEWQCRLCKHNNLTTYELGVGNNIRTEAQISKDD